MMKSVEVSLRRLNTDHLDLLYLHMWDYMTPVEEVVRGMDDLVRQGKVNYLAFSDTPDWIVAEANTLARIARLVALHRLPDSVFPARSGCRKGHPTGCSSLGDGSPALGYPGSRHPDRQIPG